MNCPDQSRAKRRDPPPSFFQVERLQQFAGGQKESEGGGQVTQNTGDVIGCGVGCKGPVLQRVGKSL